MARTRYQSTLMGDRIVALGASFSASPMADVLPLSLAETILDDHRRAAWDESERGDQVAANISLAYANELADALEDAAGQRAKFERALAKVAA